ncbi:MAG: hypothetical protein R3Y36_01685, partial [Spirochaetales bacterium]
MKDVYLSDDNGFFDEMKKTVLPFLDACKTVHSVNSCKGGTIYCETFLPEADFSAVIVIFHGFCEYCAKYDELTYYML